MDPELRRSFNELVESNQRIVTSQRLWPAFWRGVISGIGATVGAGVAIAIVASVLQNLAGINILKPFVSQVLPYVEQQGNRFTGSDEVLLPNPTYNSSPSPDDTSTAPTGATSPTPPSPD